MNNSVAKKPVLKKVTRNSIDTSRDANQATIDEDVPFDTNVTDSHSNDAKIDQLERLSQSALAERTDDEVSNEYVGRWNKLISQTNWDKGRIIGQWRQAAIDNGDDAINYSDEVWARKVEGVSSQHVGRLRRVYDRFDAEHGSYPKLFWSHFLAAMDWDDAQMYLEGASQSGWSVSQMRHQRWQANGGDADQRPQSSDIVAVDYDDAYESPTAVEDERAVDSDRDDRISTGPRAEDPDFGDESGSGNVATADDDRGNNEMSDDELLTSVNPFLTLPELPEDVADAMEQMKLAIVRHRCRDWAEFPQQQVLDVLDALRKFALQA